MAGKSSKTVYAKSPSLSSAFLASADKVVGNTIISSVVDFSQSYRGLDLRLYPAQKVILKMLWQEELSDDLSENLIEVPDDFNEHVLHVFTEVEWVNFLFETKRCNFSASMYEEHRGAGRRFGEIVLPIGRRGSKTVLIVSSAGYLVYNLYEKLEKDFFHYFSLIKTNPLYITFVSNNKNNSSKPYTMLRTFLNSSDFLSKYVYYDGADKMILLSPVGYNMLQDGTYVEGEYQLVITHSVPSGQIRGDTNIFVSLDEFCFLRDSGSQGKVKYLDEELYDATVPSTTTLIDPKTGNSWGVAAILSSVNGKNNHMYKLYTSSFGDNNTLMFHLPSFYINRNLHHETLKSKYRKSKTIYLVEYLSHFDVTLSSWLSENWDDYEACVHVGRKSTPSGVNGYSYFMGIDFGFIFDSTTIAIGHVQKGHSRGFLPRNSLAYSSSNDSDTELEVVVLDALVVISPTKDTPLDPFSVVDTISQLTKFFHIKKAIYDQYSRVTIESILDRRGLIKSGRFEVFNATQVTNDMLATLLKETILSHRIELIDSEELDLEFSGLIETSKGGFIKVENSNPSIHDDRYDAITRMVYLCLTEGVKSPMTVHSGALPIKQAVGTSNDNSVKSIAQSGKYRYGTRYNGRTSSRR
jgi:hypothetical protein